MELVHLCFQLLFAPQLAVARRESKILNGFAHDEPGGRADGE